MTFEECEYNFPYRPYPQQTRLMEELFNTIENRKIGIFESPTGTGKSLSVLCSSLHWILKNQQNEMNQLIKYKSEIQNAEIESQNDLDWIIAFDRKQKLNLKLADDIEKLEKIKIITDHIKSVKANKLKNEKNSRNDLSKLHQGDNVRKFEEEHIVNYNSDDENYDDDIGKIKEGSITKVYYCSRTHSQLSQVLKELLKTSYSDKIVTCCLGSRQNLCINSMVNNLKSINLINEKCLDLQKPSIENDENSEPSKKKAKISNSSCCSYKTPGKIEEISEDIIRTSMDIEELAKIGNERGGCPFYGVRQTLNKAHLVLMPYQNLLNPAARLASQIELRNNIIIIDEAHNLPDTISAVNAVTLTLTEIKACLNQINNYFTRYLKRLSNKNLWYLRQIIAILRNLEEFLNKGEKESFSLSCVDFVFQSYIDNFKLDKLLNYLNKSKLAFKLRASIKKQNDESELVVKNRKSRSLFRCDDHLVDGAIQPTEKTVNDVENVGNAMLVMENFLSAIIHSLDARILVNSKESLTFFVVDPGKYLTDIIKQCRSLIVIGGTMQPFSEFTDRLFKVAGCCVDDIHTFSCDHVIDASEQMKIIALGKGLTGKKLKFTFENRSDQNMIMETGDLIHSALGCCPNGAVIFFPSYDFMQTIIAIWRSSGILSKIEKLKSIFIEPKQAILSEQIMQKYAHAAQSSRGGVLFAVIGAKLSEGINFGDELARLVIVIGVPYPQINNPILREKKKFIETQYGSEIAQTMYENLAMKAVNQAIGRAIRHKNDYAAVLLLDLRYAYIANISNEMEVKKGKLGLPQWMKPAVSVHSTADSILVDLKSFFNKREFN